MAERNKNEVGLMASIREILNAAKRYNMTPSEIMRYPEAIIVPEDEEIPRFIEEPLPSRVDLRETMTGDEWRRLLLDTMPTEPLNDSVSQDNADLHEYGAQQIGLLGDTMHEHAQRLRAALLGREVREPSYHKVRHETVMKCEKEIRMEWD
jgi:hypothetical protein